MPRGESSVDPQYIVLTSRYFRVVWSVVGVAALVFGIVFSVDLFTEAKKSGYLVLILFCLAVLVAAVLCLRSNVTVMKDEQVIRVHNPLRTVRLPFSAVDTVTTKKHRSYSGTIGTGNTTFRVIITCHDGRKVQCRGLSYGGEQTAINNVDQLKQCIVEGRHRRPQ